MDAVFEQAIESLQYILSVSRDDLIRNIKARHVADWGRDNFSLGAYSWSKVGSDEARKALSKPVEETIYFAGEACYTGAGAGTVEAALASGQESAKMILAKNR